MHMFEKSDTSKIAILPLRAGSKGLPGKNIRPLNGIPLYRHTLDQALRAVGRCVITTDIPEILTADLPDKCMVISRPPHLAQDTTTMEEVLFHVFEYLETSKILPEMAVLLQATSPLRRDKDIHDAIYRYQSGQDELVMSVTPTDPKFLKYGFLKDGKFNPVSCNQYCFENRQNLPDMVRPNGAVYVFSPEDFRKNRGLTTDKIGAVEMPESVSCDIDTEADFLTVERIFKNTNMRMVG